MDKEIIRALQKDAERGLRLAIEAYKPYVYTIISRVLRGNPDDIEECVQESFLTLWKRRAQLGHIESLKPYLGLIARHQAIDRYRSLLRRQTVTLNEEFAEDVDLLLTLEQEEENAVLREAVMALEEPMRELITRRYFQFASVAELAETFGKTQSQMKGMLYRGRQRLRRDLTERGVGYEQTEQL